VLSSRMVPLPRWLLAAAVNIILQDDRQQTRASRFYPVFSIVEQEGMYGRSWSIFALVLSS
jgi:hypothetical protein